MSWSGAAAGVQDAVQQMIRQRLQEQAVAAQLKQQAFENQRQLAGDQRANEQMDITRQEHQAGLADRQFNLGGAVAEQIPANTFMPETDQAVPLLQNTGRGALLTKTDPFKAVGPDFAGPQQDPTITPEIAAVGRPGGFLKMATANQQNTLTDNDRQAAAAASTESHRQAEEAAKTAAEADRQSKDERDFNLREKNVNSEIADRQWRQAHPNAGNPTTGDDDPHSVAEGIRSGNLPPVTQGLYRNTTAVLADLARSGYDLSTARTDWQATQRHFATMNGQGQTRLREAADNAAHSLDVVEQLAGQWKGGPSPLLNRAQLAIAKSGALGPTNQKLATNLEAQINDVVSELGNVYMGGSSPTDHALALAAKDLSGNWSEDQLKSSIERIRGNIRIRQNSIRNVDVIGASDNNPYAGGKGAAAPAQPAATQEYDYVPGKGLVPRK